MVGGGQVVRVLREARTGRWNDINKSSTAPPVTRDYLALWLDHGANPHGATYAYTLLPAATADATAAYAAAPDVTVLANLPDVQAVFSRRLNVLAANFWSAGRVAGVGSVGVVVASAPCAVLVREEGDTLAVAVSDPTQTQARVTVEIGRATTGIQRADSRVQVTQQSPVTMIAVDVAGAAGGTHRVTLAL